MLMQIDLWGTPAPLPKARRRRRQASAKRCVRPDESPRYPKWRPRQCAYCQAWFRPSGPVIPAHASQGTDCPGSGRREVGPLEIPTRKYWREDAACHEIEDPRIFWVTSDGPVLLAALAYCQGCPVLENCFAWAEADTAFTGVAGGTVWTPRARKMFQRERSA